MQIAAGGAPTLSTQFGSYLDMRTPFTFSEAPKVDSLASEAVRSPNAPTSVKDDPAGVMQVATKRQQRSWNFSVKNDMKVVVDTAA